MTDTLSRLILLILIGMTQIVQAGSPVSKMTCADYLGIDNESRASTNSSGKNENKSAAFNVGFKMGVSMRQGSMANWIQGYLEGYASAIQKSYDTNLDIDNLRSMLRMHCCTHQDKTMRQVAEEFKSL